MNKRTPTASVTSKNLLFPCIGIWP